LRASILAVNDGLSTNFNFIMGVMGAGMTNRSVILAGIVSILAGAFSMGMGEWLSLSTVNDRRIDFVKAGLVSFITFVIGASIPIAPFFFFDMDDALFNSAVLCACAMFTVGVSDGKKFPIRSGIKHVIVGLSIAFVTHFIASYIPFILGG
jgi:VIT1/CCC1 family predicted Fe2+/Mn2+ transporter